MYGYHAKVMIIDLTTRDVGWESIPESILTQFIGGTGLGSYLLFRHCPAGIDPFDPENPLIFVGSPLVGSRLTTSSKFAVLTKSPLTGMIGDSLSSSFIAVELKRSGCDALIIKGRSPAPVFLTILDGNVEFHDSMHLRGMDTVETEKKIKELVGHRTRVACIGPAGEQLVRYASIANDGGRQAGRTGTGAIMGSKNLKAIGIRGGTLPKVFDAPGLNEVGRDLSRRSLGAATEKYRTMGTVANVAVFDALGTLPTRNFQQSRFEKAHLVSGETFHETHFVKNAHCANCTIGCEKIVVTNDGNSKKQGRMEYESAYSLGSLVGVGDPNAVIRASALCDEMGMDTVSAGATIAWAMESFERGILTLEDTGGLDLRFGNADAVMKCLMLIAQRDGIGDLLADGTARAAQLVGGGSDAWAMQVKGLEMPGYEPRSLKTMALALAVSTKGACHNRSSAYEADFSAAVDRFSVDDNRGVITMEGEDFSAVLDSLIWCKFLRKAFDDFYEESASIYNQVTGNAITADTLKVAGERINNMKKSFNIREGWKRSDDTLPRRVLTEKLEDGVGQGVGLSSEDLGMMIASYYKARGWTTQGQIPLSKLKELGLDKVVDMPRHNLSMRN